MPTPFAYARGPGAAWRLFGLLLCGCLSIHSQPSATFKIAGQVLRAADNRPVKGARIFISMAGYADRQLSCLSGENGEFSFSGLPAGKYQLQVNYHGWSQYWQQLDEYSTAVVTGAGLDSEHISFQLDTPASIAGSVVDDDGDPVRGAMVSLFGRATVHGMFRTRLKSMANAGMDGSFHFAHLAPGTYYVAVAGRPWYAQSSPMQFGVEENQAAPRSELDVAYPLTFYANATSAEAATLLKLEEGERAEIQFNLRAVPALHITFDGVEKRSDQQIQLFLSQIGPGGIAINIPTVQNGSGVAGIAPGDYIVSTHLYEKNQQSVIGSQAVSLTGDTTVNLSDAVKTSVSGKVVVDGEITPNLALWMANVTGGIDSFALIAHDGSFDFPQVPPGHYSLLLANTPDLYIRAVKGGSYSNGELEVAKGAQVSLTISAARGLSKVEGMVVNGNQPVAGAMVLLVPQDFSQGKNIPRDQSDSDGTFTLNGAPPGRYTLVAIDNGRGLEYGDPAVIAPYLPHGRVVDLPLSTGTMVKVEVQPRR